MKIRTNTDSMVTIFENEEDSTEEFFSKETTFDVDFVDFNTTESKKLIFAMFQFGDGSVFSLPIEEIVVIESCDKYDNDLLELLK